jgi:hypothetical protein
MYTIDGLSQGPHTLTVVAGVPFSQWIPGRARPSPSTVRRQNGLVIVIHIQVRIRSTGKAYQRILKSEICLLFQNV